MHCPNLTRVSPNKKHTYPRDVQTPADLKPGSDPPDPREDRVKSLARIAGPTTGCMYPLGYVSHGTDTDLPGSVSQRAQRKMMYYARPLAFQRSIANRTSLANPTIHTLNGRCGHEHISQSTNTYALHTPPQHTPALFHIKTTTPSFFMTARTILPVRVQSIEGDFHILYLPSSIKGRREWLTEFSYITARVGRWMGFQ